VAPISALLFTFRPIASKQLHSLITVVTLSGLGGAEVTHPLWVQEVPGLIHRSGKVFMVVFFNVVLYCPKNLIRQKSLLIICNVNLFNKLNILEDV